MKRFPNFKNKKVLILGLGSLGRGVKDAIFFAEQGAIVTVTDLKKELELHASLEQLKKYPNINFTLGMHRESDIIGADLIIRNAGVPHTSPFLQLAFAKKIPVEMDESLFAQYCPCPIVGVTGTRGKSTTSALIAKILNDCWATKSRHVYLGGNIQGEATLPLIKKAKKSDLVVLELSSWQLQGFGEKKISPDIAVFTNIYPDHLNYYKTMRDYINDKKIIFKYQAKNDFCVINNENNYTKKLQQEIQSKIIPFFKGQVPTKWKLQLSGSHNLENIAAALSAGKIFGIKKSQMRKSVESFPGLEHRLEKIRTINGVNFINDTTSTTPIAGRVALISQKTPTILIAGGASKNLNLNPFAKTIVKKTKAVILLDGTATDELEQKIIRQGGKNLIAGRFKNLDEAIKLAYSLCLPGDTILFSPGCASFGLFKNEFDRGEQFKKAVKNLS